MKFLNAFLANHAEVHDGLLFVNGGCPEKWMVKDLDEEIKIYFVGQVQYEESEIGTHQGYAIEVHGPKKDQRLFGIAERVESEFGPDDKPNFKKLWVLPIEFLASGSGLHEIVVTQRIADSEKELVRAGIWIDWVYENWGTTNQA